MRANKVGALVILAVLLALVCVASPLAGANPPAEQGVRIAASVAPLLQYQGRLLDAPTGEPLADGDHTMVFRIYSVETEGSALWTETKDVPVANGLFSTVLGDTTALDQALFNGQALWLGVKVGADPEAAPRQPLLPVPYALGLAPGALINADDVSSGTVAQARIDAAIARDAEVTSAISGHAGAAGAHHSRYTNSEALSAVLAGDGTGSTLDADLLDGQDSSAFVNTTGPDAISGSSADPILEVNQSGDGYGMAVYAANGVAVYSENDGPYSAINGWNNGTGSGVYGWNEGSAGWGGRFYSASGPALFADGAIESSASSILWVPGIEGVVPPVWGVDVSIWPNGRIGLTTTTTGQWSFYIPVSIYSVQYGQDVTVEELTVYYYTSDSSSYIEETLLVKSASAGTSADTLIHDTTHRTDTTTDGSSYSMTPTGNATLMSGSGYLTVHFKLRYASTSHTIYIGGIRLLLGHTN